VANSEAAVAEAQSLASDRTRVGELPAVSAIAGPQGAEGRDRQIFEVEGTGIRLPPGLQRP